MSMMAEIFTGMWWFTVEETLEPGQSIRLGLIKLKIDLPKNCFLNNIFQVLHQLKTYRVALKSLDCVGVLSRNLLTCGSKQEKMTDELASSRRWIVQAVFSICNVENMWDPFIKFFCEKDYNPERVRDIADPCLYGGIQEAWDNVNNTITHWYD